MSLLLRVAARPSITRALGVPIASVRGLSGQPGFEKYFSPYPTLPKSDQPKQTPTSQVPKPETSLGLYHDLTDFTAALERTPEDRWASVHEYATRELRDPGNVYTGRSVLVTEKTGFDLAAAYRRLHVILSRNRVRSELFLQRRYEKPSDRERRLKSERHRRRFAAWIRKKVQLVSEIRRRG
ncbi:hypothetical protein FRC06_000008 [Ceratobasidium sp. 370]|nr:hypothetical protein FRC06_000008 [Ceratobasidium sp. 370]